MNSNSNGMSFVEVLVALFMVAVTALAVIPMFTLASRANAVGRDQGHVGALALDQMEDLLGLDYYRLFTGGDLDSNVDGSFEVDDETGFIVRWKIEHNVSTAYTRILRVRALNPDQDQGPSSAITLTSLRARS